MMGLPNIYGHFYVITPAHYSLVISTFHSTRCFCETEEISCSELGSIPNEASF